MNKATLDYFTLKPVRGSSPTASLAADLSQNFHIDHRYVKSHATFLGVAANERQSPIAHSTSISFLLQSIRITQWPGYAHVTYQSELLLIDSREHNHAPAPILFPRARS